MLDFDKTEENIEDIAKEVVEEEVIEEENNFDEIAEKARETGDFVGTDEDGAYILVPPQPTQYHILKKGKWILTKENKAKQLEDEKQSKISANQRLYDETLQNVQDEIRYLERRKSRGKATKEDLELLERYCDLEDDLRDIKTVDENTIIPKIEE